MRYSALNRSNLTYVKRYSRSKTATGSLSISKFYLMFDLIFEFILVHDNTLLNML